MGTIVLPTTDIDREEWILLGRLGSKFVFRAQSIMKSKHRVKESPSGHRFDHAIAEGSVKFKPKVWDLAMLR